MGKHSRPRSLDVPAPSMASLPRAPDPSLPPPIPSATRRDLFGAFASMLLLVPTEAGASKAEELDGELLACCAEAVDACTRGDALGDATADMLSDDPRWPPALDEMRDLGDEIRGAVEEAAALPARTPEGLRAKAGLLLAHYSEDTRNPQLALSLARDVLGRAGA